MNFRGEVKWIKLGDLDLESDIDDARPIVLPVAEAVLHPNYNKDVSIYDDIGLFKSEYSVIFNNYVKPICLKSMPPTLDDTVAKAAGWGTVEFGNE